MSAHEPLSLDALYRHCDPSSLDFETTADLADLDQMLGQDRAVSAVELGTGLRLDGYNLFVLGPPGTGRHTFVMQYLQRKAAGEARPSDWCYVNNFGEPRRPLALELPAGLGRQFRDDVAALIEEARTALPAAFESEDYRNQRQEIEEEARKEQARAFQEVQEHATKRDLGIIETPTGFAFVPLRKGERVITPRQYSQLSEEEREKLQQDTRELGEEFREMLDEIPRRVRKVRARISELDHGVALFAVGSLVAELLMKYGDLPAISEYLRHMQDDIVDNVQLFLKDESKGGAIQLLAGPTPATPIGDAPAARRYGINLMIDHADADGAPVVFEDHPTYPLLVGQIEHISSMGTLLTDFQLIRPGALHRANGGYLVLDAREVLLRPFAWDALKRALKSQVINVQSLDQIYGLASTVSMEPAPIPLSVKVVLVGEPILYYLLQAYEPEFVKLFKVEADFDTQMERSGDNTARLARLIATIARREELRCLDREAVARVVEASSRHAGDAEMLSTRIAALADIVREAHHWAGQDDSELIGAQHIQQAIDHQEHRASRIRDRIHREIRRDTIMIDTTGSRTGQANGLSVMQIGRFAFGQPCRITARVSLGTGKVVDIEREVELGGPIHSKGVLILSNFLASNYVTDRPLSLSASLVFEQSYAGVEGDSASAAELCALLSALSGLPIRQNLAITGSINQHGQIQAIGGVNEKIEGFFDVCRDRELTGDQGVLIPAANVKHLMLKSDVREAVAAGRFRIHATSHIDDCMALLTGRPAGTPDADGKYPADTVNGLVVARLVQMADQRRAFQRSQRKSGKGGKAKSQ